MPSPLLLDIIKILLFREGTIIKYLWPFIKPFKKQLILGPSFKLIEAIFELLLPLCMAKLIDQGIRQHHFPVILHQSLAILIFSLLGLIAVFICQYMASIASQGFGTALRETLFKKIQTLPMEAQQKLGISSLINRITVDTNQLQLAVAMLIRLVIRAPFLGIGSIFMAWMISPKLTLIFMTTLPLFFILLLLIMKKNLPAFSKVEHALDHFNASIIENIEGTLTIRSTNQTQQFSQTLCHNSQAIKQSSIKAGYIASMMTPLTTFMINTATALLLYMGGHLLGQHTLAVGDLVALVNYLSQMLMALIVISNLVVTFSKAGASAKRIIEILSVSTIDTPNVEYINDSLFQLDLNHIGYRYNGMENNQMNHLSLTIKEGEHLAITGPMGSGKTTLIRLILGELSPNEGTITLNQLPIQTLSKKAYQSIFTYVPQKVVLFKGTIRSNLKFANPNVSDEDMWKALETAQAHFVHQLPLGLDTPVEKMGTNFSGGQKQRLTIARALLKENAHFLVMDHCFSALDIQTEAKILDNLKRHYPRLTLINISQRPQSLKFCQKIAVLERGRLSALGDDTTLRMQNLFYKHLMEGSHE